MSQKTKVYPPLSGRETSSVHFVWLEPGEDVVWIRDRHNNVTGYTTFWKNKPQIPETISLTKPNHARKS